jgi:hypothetical protein
MPDPVSLSALFDAADQAAMAGDYAAAARHLGEAASVQEATLGPDHLDLANTLNNLAVAHERCGEIDAAEREYRRAHALAARIRPADDPLVTTSAQNLREFCEAHGRPVDPPTPVVVGVAPTPPPRSGPAPSVPATPNAPATPVVTTPAARAAEPVVARPAASARATPPPPAPVTPTTTATRTPPPAASPSRRVPIPALVGIGAIVVILIWLLMGRGPTGPPAEPQAAAPEPATPAPTTPAPTPGGATSPAPPAPPPAVPPPVATTAAPATPAASAAGSDVTIGDAELCASLSSSYRCEPARSPVAPGRLTFYTRLIASRDTSVVHRWYRGDQLRQAVRLGVAARRGGYRTFSRGTVTATDGDWRVELRTQDGRLLHTERFTVR